MYTNEYMFMIIHFQQAASNKPYWILRLVSEQREADILEVKKDTQRADEIKAMKQAWESAEPGRAIKVIPECNLCSNVSSQVPGAVVMVEQLPQQRPDFIWLSSSPLCGRQEILHSLKNQVIMYMNSGQESRSSTSDFCRSLRLLDSTLQNREKFLLRKPSTSTQLQSCHLEQV